MTSVILFSDSCQFGFSQNPQILLFRGNSPLPYLCFPLFVHSHLVFFALQLSGRKPRCFVASKAANGQREEWTGQCPSLFLDAVLLWYECVCVCVPSRIILFPPICLTLWHVTVRTAALQQAAKWRMFFYFLLFIPFGSSLSSLTLFYTCTKSLISSAHIFSFPLPAPSPLSWRNY